MPRNDQKHSLGIFSPSSELKRPCWCNPTSRILQLLPVIPLVRWREGGNFNSFQGKPANLLNLGGEKEELVESLRRPGQ